MRENVFKDGKRKGEWMQCLLICGVGIGLFTYSLYHRRNEDIAWVMSPYLFPQLVSVFLLFLSVSLFAEIRQKQKAAVADEKIEKKVRTADWKKVGITFATILLYYFIMPYIGFLISGVLFLLGMFWLLGERRIWLVALLSVGTPLILYGLFHGLLHVMLP